MLTKIQQELMKHTISGCNRNWFGTSKDCSDAKQFDKLVEMGFATEEKAASWMGDDVIYRLTTEGRRELQVNPQKKGE